MASFLLSSEENETLSLNDDSRKLKLIAGAYSLPKQRKEKPLGEDAFFVYNDKQAIGVADGVGGTTKRGIDSGIYARELMNRAANFVRSHPGSVDPMIVLNQAFRKTRSQGAATACIITLKDNTLHAVNVGDPGFLIIRYGSEIVYKSPIQQSYFNCPFQLGNSNSANSLTDGDEMTFEVKSGDVIVAATDGIFDNVFDYMIGKTVSSCLKARYLAKVTASKLANLGREESLVTNKPSPWTKEAVRNGLNRCQYMGGKYDDVTVAVACVY